MTFKFNREMADAIHDKLHDQSEALDHRFSQLERQLAPIRPQAFSVVLCEAQVFERYGIGRCTLQAWLDAGLRAFKVHPRTYVRHSDLLRFINQD